MTIRTALLIAAAPDLLEAAEWTAYGCYDPSDPSSVLAFLRSCQERAEKAIKATISDD